MTHRTRVERRAFSAAAFIAMMAVFAVPWATAQTGHARAKPKPAAAPSAALTASVAVTVSAPVAPASGPVPPPPAPSGEGGVRASPLNPAAEEMPGAAASVAPPVPTVDYDKLLGDIAALRARVADAGDALFVSRIVLALQTDGDHAKIGHLTVALDDGIVYTAPASFARRIRRRSTSTRSPPGTTPSPSRSSGRTTATTPSGKKRRRGSSSTCPRTRGSG